MKIRTMHILLIIAGLFALQFEYKYEWYIVNDFLPELRATKASTKKCGEELGGWPDADSTPWAEVLIFHHARTECALAKPDAQWRWTLMSYETNAEAKAMRCYLALLRRKMQYRSDELCGPIVESRDWPHALGYAPYKAK